jgi:hypothetical protein
MRFKTVSEEAHTVRPNQLALGLTTNIIRPNHSHVRNATTVAMMPMIDPRLTRSSKQAERFGANEVRIP